ncbi:MAG TPA: phosphate signaling complex protein PhoU [Saprospiraceae bacterium]|nr:phosphate signaling complex protein PhoU [Saprospiraceae bacterium]
MDDTDKLGSMTHLEEEIAFLKSEITEMWQMVISQLHKTREALLQFDKDLAREVVATEKRINSLELKIDRQCENIFALFNPVAVDLRTVLAVLKINNNLERSGDIAEGIAKYIIFADLPFDQELVESTQILRMYEESTGILEDVLTSFENEDTRLARSIFKRDELVDEINYKATAVVADYIRHHPDKVEQGLYIISMMRKLERIGDHCKNIAEEIIFNVEAKVLKHKGKKSKME